MKNKSLKKLFAFSLAMLMAVVSVPFTAFTAIAESDVVEIWLDAAGGSDSNTGLTKAQAVGTIAKAFALAEASASAAKKVIVAGDYTVTGDLPAHSSMITVTGDGTGSSNICTDRSFATNGPTTFADINFHYTKNYCFINSGAYKFAFGDNVTFSNGVNKDASDGSLTNYTSILAHFGAQDANIAEMLEFELNSGVSASVGPYYNSETRTAAGAKITVNGGTPSINLSADGWKAYGQQFGTVYTDTVSIVLNGGSFTSGLSRIYPTDFEANVQLIANNGLTLPEDPYFIFEEGYGLYKLCAEAEAGCALDTTDVAGKFEVIGGKTALAVSETGKRYISANGYLTVPAGEYTVTFDDEIYYTNDGETIEFYKDFELDITTVDNNAQEGRYFMGWTYEDGTAPTDSSFTAGEKLYAHYVELDPEKDFYIEGAQIRLRNPTSNIGEGLRFVIRKSNAADALNITSYGSVIVPSLAAGKLDVEIGKVYTYESKEYAVKKVPAENIFAKYDDFERYTVCVTKISDERYANLFSVRGYIEYTDYNGENHTIYTDYYATNLVNVAEMVLKDDKFVEKAAKARCEALIETEKQRVRDKYNNLEKITLSNNYPTGASTVSLDKIYQLGEGGVSVREVLIETGDTSGEAVEIFQVSDTHFNYLNAADFEEAHPSTLASYNGRQWLKDGSSVPNAVKTLEYASQGDAIVITGDVLDYLSLGAIELMHKYIWDPYPNAIITLGNHEFSRRCQDNPSTPDPTTPESRYQILQDNWKHDIYYYSEVVKDKVMIIQLDNGDIRFWDCQIEPLQRDLALAREKGYTVLLFYHIPLCTYNPAETDVYPIRRNDQFNHNFCDNNVGKPGSDQATLTVYDIITNNADIIKGGFCGHAHSDYYTEIIAKNADGTSAVIPQWVLTAAAYDGGHALKITVK